MASVDLRAFVRANLPDPPSRVLEVGAGAGSLARTLRAAGYEVVAIDPRSESDDVRVVALADLDEPPGSFAAAVAIVSLHHVDPLEQSCRRLGELVEPGGTLVVDEFDVAALEPDFEFGPPLRGAWLHRWNLADSLRGVEEDAIARGQLAATGARLVGRRRDPNA